MLVEVAAGDPHAGPGGVVTRSSVARGRAMSPGIQQAPFYWRDVVHGPRPRRRERGTCLHITYHGADDSGDVRLALSTVIHVDAGHDKDSVWDDVIHVEERLNVQRRFLQEWIDRERAFSDKIALRSRSRLAHSLASQRRFVNTVRYGWVVWILLALIRLQARVGNFLIRTTRSVMRGLVAVPDLLLTHTSNVSVHLASRSGRRTLKQALRDPASGTPQEKTAVLVLIIFGLVGAVLLLNTLFATFLSRWSGAYAHLLGDFTASLAGTLALPLPAEIFYINSAIAMGVVLGGVGLLAGKITASWMLYLLGDSLFDTLNKKSGPRMKRAIGWLQTNANRWGVPFLVVLNAVPLAPDALIIVFAVSGMRFRGFMMSITIGSILKLVLLGTMILLIGPDAVKAFIEHPIQTMRGGVTS